MWGWFIRALIVAALFVVATACRISPLNKNTQPIKLCIEKRNWTRLETLMTTFGARNHMQLHGEISRSPKSPPPGNIDDQFNYSLVRGLRQFGADNFNLWMVSNPFTDNEVDLNVLSRNPLSENERDVERGFLRELRPLMCSAAS